MAKLNFLKGSLSQSLPDEIRYCTIQPALPVINTTGTTYIDWNSAVISDDTMVEPNGIKLQIKKKGLFLVTGAAFLMANEMPINSRHMITLTSNRPHSEFYQENTGSELSPFIFMSVTMQFLINARATDSYLMQAVYSATAINVGAEIDNAPMVLLWFGEI